MQDEGEGEEEAGKKKRTIEIKARQKQCNQILSAYSANRISILFCSLTKLEQEKDINLIKSRIILALVLGIGKKAGQINKQDGIKSSAHKNRI